MQQSRYLEQPRDDVHQQLQQRLLGDAFNDLGLHLDGSQVDGVVGRLHDGTQHLDALLRVDGARQRGRRLLRRSHHLQQESHAHTVSEREGAPLCYWVLGLPSITIPASESVPQFTATLQLTR